MKPIASIYLENEEKFEPIKKVRKIWIRRPETRIKEKRKKQKDENINS